MKLFTVTVSANPFSYTIIAETEERARDIAEVSLLIGSPYKSLEEDGRWFSKRDFIVECLSDDLGTESIVSFERG